MKKEHLMLVAIIVLGIFLRFYRLDTQYIQFNDTFFRLTPALELSQGTIPRSYGGMPGISFLFAPAMFIKSSVMTAQIVIALFGVALIPLSYYFSKKLSPENKITSILLALFVSINPSFVALSKVMMWDIIVLFFIVSTLITTLKTAKKYSLHFTVFHFLLLFFLVFLKAPNLLLFPFSLLYILCTRCFDDTKEMFSKPSNSIKKLFSENTKDVWAGVFIFFVMYGLYFYTFPQIMSTFLSRGGTAFFQSSYYYLNFMGTVRTLMAPLNAPATNIYFTLQTYSENYLLLVFFSTFQILIAIWGIFSLKNKKYAVFLLSIFFVYAGFYFFFTGWSARYLCISIFVLLFFLSLGIGKTIETIIKQKVSKNSFFSLYLIMGLVASLSFSVSSLYSMEKEWGTQKSLKENYIEINYEDAPYILGRGESEDTSLIVTSYGKWLEFFKIAGGSDIEVLDMFDIESEEDLIDIISERIENNEIVWYIKGWPEGYEYGDMNRMYDKIEENYRLEKIYEGGRPYTKKDGTMENSFLVYRLQKL